MNPAGSIVFFTTASGAGYGLLFWLGLLRTFGLVPGNAWFGLVSLGLRFPLGDVCKMEVFGTRNAEECRFLWPPSGDQSFLEALRLQAESFVRWVGGAVAEGASALDAVAALDAAGRASRIFQIEAEKR